MNDKQNQIMAGLAGWCQPEKREATSKLIAEIRPSLIAEAGTFGGSWLIPAAMAEPRPFWAVGMDPYDAGACLEGMTTPESIAWWGRNEMLEGIYQGLLTAIEALELKNVVIHRARAEDRAVHFIAGCLDIFHSDANHALEPTLRTAQLYLPKIRVGGVFIQDDRNWVETAADGTTTETVKPTIQWLLANGCEILLEVAESIFFRKVK